MGARPESDVPRSILSEARRLHSYCWRVPDDSNSQLLGRFLAYLKIEKGLASLTITAYSTDLTQFADFLQFRRRPIRKARQADVSDFLQQLFANGMDGRSVGRKLSALRQLYRYLLLDKLVEKDPTLNLESPKQWKVLPKALASDEMELLLKGPRQASNTRVAVALALRDRAVLEVL